METLRMLLSISKEEFRLLLLLWVRKKFQVNVMASNTQNLNHGGTLALICYLWLFISVKCFDYCKMQIWLKQHKSSLPSIFCKSESLHLPRPSMGPNKTSYDRLTLPTSQPASQVSWHNPGLAALSGPQTGQLRQNGNIKLRQMSSTCIIPPLN